MTRPAILLILLATICIGSLLWMLLPDGGGTGVSVPAAHESPEPVAPRELPAQPRIALPQQVEPEPEQFSPDEPTAKPPLTLPNGEGSGLLTLEVVDQQTGAELARFNLVLSGPDRDPLDRWIDSGRLELPLALDEHVDISIEAPGFEPQRIEDLSLSDAEPQRSLRIELRPVVTASGVSLDVLGPRMLAVPQVRLRVLFRDLNSRVDEPLAILWQRDASSEIGHYDLPDLAPGHYRFEVQALDESGALAPMQLGRHALSYYGAEQVPIPMQLEAGGLLSLLVREQTGAILGTEVLLRLEDAQSKPIETRWLATNEDGTLEAFDMLPAAKRCRLGQALPPGDYKLRLRGKGRETGQHFRLEPGQKLDLEVLL